MTREIAVAIHAGAGIAGLAVGLFLFAPPDTSDGRRRTLRVGYGVLLVILIGSLFALIVSDWDGLGFGARMTFTGLAVLGLVMILRLSLAHGLASSRETGWRRRYVSHIYFTYVSLWVGFAIVPALRTDSPGVWIPIAVVAVLGTGTVLIHRYERSMGIRDRP